MAPSGWKRRAPAPWPWAPARTRHVDAILKHGLDRGAVAGKPGPAHPAARPVVHNQVRRATYYQMRGEDPCSVPPRWRSSRPLKLAAMAAAWTAQQQDAPTSALTSTCETLRASSWTPSGSPGRTPAHPAPPGGETEAQPRRASRRSTIPRGGRWTRRSSANSRRAAGSAEHQHVAHHGGDRHREDLRRLRLGPSGVSAGLPGALLAGLRSLPRVRVGPGGGDVHPAPGAGSRGVDVLVLDILPSSRSQDPDRRDLLEILEDRYGTRSTIRHQPGATESLARGDSADPTLADAICDRLPSQQPPTCATTALHDPHRRKEETLEP